MILGGSTSPPCTRPGTTSARTWAPPTCTPWKSNIQAVLASVDGDKARRPATGVSRHAGKAGAGMESGLKRRQLAGTGTEQG